MISGVPFFDPRGGRFCGFRGTARRVQEDAAVAAEELASPTPAAPTILAERRQEQKEPPSPDAIRQMTHELRTPLNAIVGFAEMIDRQMLGPDAQSYRDRAQRSEGRVSGKSVSVRLILGGRRSIKKKKKNKHTT